MDTKRTRMQNEFSELFRSERGKVVLRHLMAKFHFHTDPYVISDPNATAYHLGEMNAVRYILEMIQATDIGPFEMIEANRQAINEFNPPDDPIESIMRLPIGA